MRSQTAGVVLASSAVGGLIMAVVGRMAGNDPAGTLASTLGLGSGVILGAILGGLLGAWLVLGGRKRIAATAGFLLAVVFLFGVWRVAESYVWVVDVVLNEVFGEGGEQYSGLVLFVIAVPLFRAVAGAGRGLVGRLLERGAEPRAEVKT